MFALRCCGLGVLLWFAWVLIAVVWSVLGAV